jgi:RimJ/RimL family protein N-acetyltransferase
LTRIRLILHCSHVAVTLPVSLPSIYQIGFVRVYPLKAARLESCLAEADAGRKRLFAAVGTESGRAIGHIKLSHIVLHLSAFMSRVLIGEAEFRGRGFGLKLVQAFARYPFEEYEFHRLDLGVLPTNTRAIRTYEKFGVRYVGTWPDGLKKGDVAMTVNWMTLFWSDWHRKLVRLGADS